MNNANVDKKFWQHFKNVLLIVTISPLFSNCATTTKSKITTLPDLAPQDLHRIVSQNFEKLHSFQGKARVIIELPGSGHNGFSEVFINFPDSIFVKTEAMLGIDIGSLFLDSRIFGAYAPRENVLYYGEVEQLDLREFLQVELSTNELYEALTGLVQITFNDASLVSIDHGQYVLASPLADGEIRYWIDPNSFLVTKSSLANREGKILLSKEMQRIRIRGGVALPQTIRLTRPLARERITVYYTDQKVNRPIAAAKFRLQHASNARRVYWGDLDRPQVDRNLSK